jgi:hypothetical protein
MRLYPPRQSAYISLIRRRSRPIVSQAPASFGKSSMPSGESSDVNIDRGIEDPARNRLTVGPSISARHYDCRSKRLTSASTRVSLREARAAECAQAFTTSTEVSHGQR